MGGLGAVGGLGGIIHNNPNGIRDDGNLQGMTTNAAAAVVTGTLDPAAAPAIVLAAAQEKSGAVDGDAAVKTEADTNVEEVKADADENVEEAKAEAKENGEEDRDEVDEEEDQDEEDQDKEEEKEEEHHDQDEEEDKEAEADVEAVKAEQPAAAADDEADGPNEGDEAKCREGPPEALAAPARRTSPRTR